MTCLRMSRDEVERIRAAAVDELAELVRLNNDVENSDALQINALALRAQFEKRGFAVTILDTPTGRPAVFAELAGNGDADQTLLVYSHYDGVPAGDGWRSDPYAPILRSEPGPGGSLGSEIPWPQDGRFDPTWRLVGRSSADSKGSIVAVLNAVDLLGALGEKPGVHLKVLLDGEEERESPSLPALLAEGAETFAADALVYATGEVHPSGLPTVQLGARGILILEITTWTASSSAHSGHFGSFVPNAALALCRLLASLKDADGQVSVDGFEAGIEPLGIEEVAALTATPLIDRQLASLFSLHHPEVGDVPWHHLRARPTLNVRGMRSGALGREAANIIPHRATAELDLRLVAGQEPDLVQSRIESHLRRSGATILDRDPTPDEIRSTPLVVTVRRLAGFPAVRTSAGNPMVTRIIEAVGRVTDSQVVVEPTDGGSLPLHLFHGIAPVVMGLPTSNSDNRQHAADENLQLQFLFRAIDVWSAVLRWPSRPAPPARVPEASRTGAERTVVVS